MYSWHGAMASRTTCLRPSASAWIAGSCLARNSISSAGALSWRLSAIEICPPFFQDTSTTLSDPQLSKSVFRLIHPVQVSRPTDQKQAGEDLLDKRAHLRKRQPWSGAG